MENNNRNWQEFKASDADTAPSVGQVVIAQIQHLGTSAVKEVLLVRVSEDDVFWRTVEDLAEFDEWNWNVQRWSASPLFLMEKAPLPEAFRGILARSQVAQTKAAGQDFELGCWLVFYKNFLNKVDSTTARVDCLRRLFQAGYATIETEFQTFRFGHQELEKLFAASDLDKVIKGLKAYAADDATGNITKALVARGFQ